MSAQGVLDSARRSQKLSTNQAIAAAAHTSQIAMIAGSIGSSRDHKPCDNFNAGLDDRPVLIEGVLAEGVLTDGV